MSAANSFRADIHMGCCARLGNNAHQQWGFKLRVLSKRGPGKPNGKSLRLRTIGINSVMTGPGYAELFRKASTKP